MRLHVIRACYLELGGSVRTSFADSGRMSRPHPLRRRCAEAGVLPPISISLLAPSRAIGRPLAWTVTGDWPKRVPVADVELDLLEAWLGAILDEPFRSSL